MRLNKIDKREKTGFIEFDDDEEVELLDESMNILIKKQEESVEANNGDILEVKQLNKFKKTKFLAIDIPKKQKEKIKKLKDRLKEGQEGQFKDKDKNDNKIKGAKPEEGGDSGPTEFISQEDSKVHYKNVYDIANALNEHINLLETSDDASYKNKDKKKYEKLKDMLEKTQSLKSEFERVTPRPTKFGRLKK